MSSVETKNETDSSPFSFLMIPITIAALWILALLLLVLQTANPVTLNREQILKADFVVTATAENPPLVEVSKEWKHGEVLENVRIPGIEQQHANVDGPILIPLTKTGPSSFEVTPTNLPDRARLIYPATESATEQLAEILKPSAN